jgi:uncharacterized protein (TIGR02996 family)
MNHLTFVRAMLDEPEGDLPRLAFADWLEERGEEARAEWIRGSCRLAQTHYNDPAFGDVVTKEREAFLRCRPTWWAEITGVYQYNRRGLFRFEVRSRTALTRLGKVRWLEKAVAEGWLEGISISWCDGSLARVVAGWKGFVREIPLFVSVGPQV